MPCRVAAAIPSSYTAVFTDTAATGSEVVREGLADRQRRLQADLVLAEFRQLLEDHMLPWVMQVSVRTPAHQTGYRAVAQPLVQALSYTRVSCSRGPVSECVPGCVLSSRVGATYEIGDGAHCTIRCWIERDAAVKCVEALYFLIQTKRC